MSAYTPPPSNPPAAFRAFLRVDLEPGLSIEQAAAEICSIAWTLGFPAHALHNGVRVHARPSSSIGDVVARLRRDHEAKKNPASAAP